MPFIRIILATPFYFLALILIGIGGGIFILAELIHGPESDKNNEDVLLA